jgi:hypothetical protein
VTSLVVAAGYLAYASMVDRVVDEALPAGPTLAAGAFRSIAHATSGAGCRAFSVQFGVAEIPPPRPS